MAFWTASRWLHAVQGSGLPLLHNLLRRKTQLGLCCYHSKEKMAKAVQARRLEGVDKNIWVEFASLAATYKTVNLGQGFPNFSPPDFVKEAYVEAVGGEETSLHQYTQAFGHPRLVEVLARFFGKLLQQDLDPLRNVLVTVGAYEGLFCCFQALVDEGDEVIIIEPFFDCYEPMVKMAGGKPVFIPLRLDDEKSGQLSSSRDWRLDPAELESKFTKRTKALVLNSPNNPLGKVFSRGEMELIADLCVRHDIVCFSDEVYEWLTYDGNEHIRIASLPGMWERTVTIGSAGKTFSATGWKVGWAIGPDRLLKHLRTVHQNSVYHCATAAQEAVACGLEKELGRFGKPESYFVQLRQQLQQKRDLLMESLVSVGLKPIVPEGTYFLIADLSSFLNNWLTKKSHKQNTAQLALLTGSQPVACRGSDHLLYSERLAAIPVSAFYSLPQKKHFDHFIRFCFAKEDSTLKAAGDILKEWSQEMHHH